MSQSRKQTNMPATSPANTAVNKDRLNIKDIENMSPHQQSALLHDLENEIKAETVSEAAPLLEFVLNNIKTIITVIVVAIIALGGWGFWSWQSENTNAEAHREFQQVASIQDPHQKLEALSTFAESAPQSLRVGVLIEEAATATQVGYYALAATKLQEAIAIEKDSPLGLSLYLALSDVYLTENKNDEALALMEEYITVVPENLYSAALQELALVAEIQGSSERAIEVYTELLTLPTTDESTSAYFQDRITKLSQ